MMTAMNWVFTVLLFTFYTEATVIGNAEYNSYCETVNKHLPKSCLDFLCLGFTTDNVYTIYPTEDEVYSIDVFCDQTSDGGGWTVFQRRMNGLVDFYRNWKEYQLGFGEIDEEHWLGNDIIAELTSLNIQNELRVDLEDFDNVRVFAQYSTFNVGNKLTSYELDVNGYFGDAGDALDYHRGSKFSTHDYDNDSFGDGECSELYKGAWWYKICHASNLNGHYYGGPHSSYADGVNWKLFKGYYYSLKVTEMKFRKQL